MNYLPPLPVALPLAVAALFMATGSILRRRARDAIAIATAVAVAVVCGLLLDGSLGGGPIVYWFGGWRPREGVAVGIAFVIDPLGAGLALLVAVLTIASLVFSWRYFDEAGPLFPALMLVFLGAMAGFCLTGDLFNLFVFFELMSVSAYALTAHKIEEEQALMGAFNFAVTNSVGAFLVLTGIGLLYGRTGALNLAQIGRALASGPADGLVIVALMLVTCGFGVKAALAPFQFWLADAHAVAPTPVCVLFSGVMVELGLYAIARVYWTVFAGPVEAHAPVVRAVWVGFGILTALVGGVMCFGERHLKRLLAFSTISHTGIFLAGVALLSPQGLAGTALYVVGHGLVKGALFLTAGVLLNRFASVDENYLHGKGRRFPGLAVLFFVAGLALSGLPPFATWLGKSLIEVAADHGGYAWLSPVLLVASALTGGAVLRTGGQVFLGVGAPQNEGASTPATENKATKENYDRPPWLMVLPVVALLALALAAGLWPGLERGAREAADRLEDRHAYAAAVLDGANHYARAAEEHEGSKLPGVLNGLGAACGAVLLAVVALYRHRVPEAVRAIANRTGGRALAGLRALHSGNVADYVAWVVIGLAVMGGLFSMLFRS